MKTNKELLLLDPFILLSIINLKLRDFYANLEIMCEDLDLNQIQIEEKLGSIGYIYNKNTNQFINEKAI